MSKTDPKIRRAREEAEARRRQRRLNIIILILLLGIFGESVYLISQSKLFNVQEVQVRGNQRVTTKRIILLSGIKRDTNMFRLSTADVSSSVKREVYVERAGVRRVFPLKVIIDVKERQPVAVLTLEKGFALIDKAGLVLQIEKENIFPSLPVIKDLKGIGNAVVGRTLSSRSLKNALLCLRHLQTELKNNLVLISAPSIDGLAFQLKSGMVILYGKVEMQEGKNFAIKAITAQAESSGQRLKYIDVRVPSNPAAMPE